MGPITESIVEGFRITEVVADFYDNFCWKSVEPATTARFCSLCPAYFDIRSPPLTTSGHIWKHAGRVWLSRELVESPKSHQGAGGFVMDSPFARASATSIDENQLLVLSACCLVQLVTIYLGYGEFKELRTIRGPEVLRSVVLQFRIYFGFKPEP